MKLISVLVTFLAVISVTDGRTLPLKTSNTHSDTRVLAAGVFIDRQKKIFDVYIDLKNNGSKGIRGLRWEYHVQENWNGDGFGTTVTGTTSLPELLLPNRNRKITLTNNKRIKRSELEQWLRRVDNENGSLRITGIQFADGSQWTVSSGS